MDRCDYCGTRNQNVKPRGVKGFKTCAKYLCLKYAMMGSSLSPADVFVKAEEAATRSRKGGESV